MTAQMNIILERITSRDKDFRYMAMSDLSHELSKPNFRFDSAQTEKAISIAILNQLYDQSSDISSLSTKCLSLIGTKATKEGICELASNLVRSMVDEKKPTERDAAALGLRTLIANVNDSYISTISQNISGKLLEGLKSETLGVPSNCMDIIADMIGKYGLVFPDTQSLKAVLLDELEQGRSGVRKRAIQCLGSLAGLLKEESELDDLVEGVLCKFRDPKDFATCTMLMQTIANLVRGSGGQMSKHAERLMPIVLSNLQNAAEAEEQEELMEVCLITLEIFVQRCPAAMKLYIEQLLSLVKTYIKYDPNMIDFDEEMDEESMDADKEDELDEEEELYSDDEDSSWKVRRASAKLSSAMISHFHDDLKVIYDQIHNYLLMGLKEREEAVRPVMYAAYMELVDAMGMASHRGDQEAKQYLEGDAPKSIRCFMRHLKDNSMKTKSLALQALQSLTRAAPLAVGQNIDCAIPGILNAMQDTASGSSAMKLDALELLYLLISLSDPITIQSSMKKFAPAVFSATDDRYYATSAKALRVCEHLVYVIRPQCPGPVAADLSELVKPLFECAMDKLRALDKSQEVKEAAISCCAVAASRLSDQVDSVGDQVGDLAAEFANMPDKNSRARKRTKRESGNPVSSSHLLPTVSNIFTKEVLLILGERIKNENTRLNAVRGLQTIAKSPLSLDFSIIVNTVIPELSGFLRKANRILRLASLECLSAIISRTGQSLGDPLIKSVIKDSSGLIAEADLVLATAALQLDFIVVNQYSQTSQIVREDILPRAINLIKSNLLQNPVLEAIRKLVWSVSCIEEDAEPILKMLRDVGTTSDGTVGSPLAAAQCAATVCSAMGPPRIHSEIKALLEEVRKCSAMGESDRRFALLCLGEMGRISKVGEFDELPNVFTNALADETVAEAASHALGAVACGNMETYLPLVLHQVKSQSSNNKQEYHLLRALKEVIGSSAYDKINNAKSAIIISEQANQILDLLICASGEQSDEECRAVLAECLGLLTLVAPEKVISSLQNSLSENDDAGTRWLAITSLKHAAVDQQNDADKFMADILPMILVNHLADQDLGVRTATVQLLSAAAHNKPSLIRSSLPNALPKLLKLTERDSSLVRVVNLGPFKHKVDDGLKVRKAAYECLGILMTKCYHDLNPNEIFNAILVGLSDEYDVKMRCHGLIAKLSTLAPNVVSANLDSLVEPLTATLNTKLKSDAVKQEVDRNDDLLRSCFRAIGALASLPGTSNNKAFKAFMDSTVNVGAMKERFEAVEAERKSAEGGVNQIGQDLNPAEFMVIG